MTVPPFLKSHGFESARELSSGKDFALTGLPGPRDAFFNRRSHTDLGPRAEFAAIFQEILQWIALGPKYLGGGEHNRWWV